MVASVGIVLRPASTALRRFLVIVRTPKVPEVRDDRVGASFGWPAGSVPVLLAQWWERGHRVLSGTESVKRQTLLAGLASILAGTLSGNSDEWRRPDPKSLIAVAEEEGVTALLADSLLRAGWTPRELPRALMDRARERAKMELGQHAALVAVLATLHAAGIPVLVLKGTALRCWLYPEPYLRESSDLDLLFATREGAMLALEALQPMGYAAPYVPGRFAHEILCRHAVNRVDLDLHWGLSRNPAMAFLPGFQALRSAAQPLPALGRGAWGLGAVDALLHACIHRASNLEGGLGDRLKWLYDVHLLATRLDAGEWNSFAAACRMARVSGIARDALAAASNMFGTVLSSDALGALQAGIPDDVVDASRLQDWIYLQRQSLRALPGWSARGAWLVDRMFPPFGYMREVYGRDLTRMGLLRCRLRGLFGRLLPAKLPARN